MVCIMSAKRLFTVGHSNREPAEFVELLLRHGVTTVADVRSQPYSRHLPQFNRETLTEWLARRGISYIFLGEELGARRSEPECYVDGQARYELIAKTPAFRKGLDRIRSRVEQDLIALMCAEKDPLVCHRTILVAKALRSEMEIEHIISKEEVQSHQELEERLLGLWNLEEPDLYLTREQRLQLAYEQQSARIAFVEKELVPPRTEKTPQ